MTEHRVNNIRTDAETWRRLRVGAVTAGLSTGKFLGVLLDAYERAQRVSAADEHTASGEYLEAFGLQLDTSPILPDLGPFCSHCGGDRGARQPCDSDGLGCLENIYHFEDQEQP